MLGYQNDARVYAPSAAQQHVLLQRVSYLLATGLLVTALGAWTFRDLPAATFFPILIAVFVLLFAMRAVARKPGINVLVFYLFSLAEGAFIGPWLASYVKHVPNGGNLVWEAFLLTAITVAGVGSYAYTSGKDFGFLGRALMWALFAAIIFGVASWFIAGLGTPVVFLGYESIIVAIFVGFLLYDFSNIRLRYSPEDYTLATVNVYLDFLNLFLAILNILAMLQGGGTSRRR
jgi:FtsH-binding integral membrane protein